ncbi:MAG: zinc ribbon domain-containing protein [Verrucomicrobia bacterium]|nr:zinc ribbon domain-containing protein [Verrucomicrobiota bacterium]
MVFACPKCAQAVRLSQAACPACGFSLTLGAVVAHYWSRLTHRVREQSAIRCPQCGQASPLASETCPHCHFEITVDSTVNAVLEPPRRRWRLFVGNASPATRRRIQWAYLLSSGLFIWWLLAYIEEHHPDHWVRHAMLSAVYCAVLAFIVLLLTPRKLLAAISQRTTALVKLALLLNYLSFVLLLQMWIGTWWVRAIILAGVFGVTWLAAWLLTSVILPMTNQVRGIYEPPNANSPFDPAAPQGRRGRYD